MPNFSTFTGCASTPLWSNRIDTPDNPIVPADELKWLRDNPTQVARIHQVRVVIAPEFDLTAPAYAFSIRLLDPREADGWRLATVYLHGTAHFSLEQEQTLNEAWRDHSGEPARENSFVLTALNEAVYAGEYWPEPLLQLLVLPDPSLLDPEGWGADFTPYARRT